MRDDRSNSEWVDAEVVDESDGTEAGPPDSPSAGLPARFGAVCLDLILIIAVFALLLFQFVLPQYYPGAIDEMIRQMERAAEDGETVTPSENLQEAIRTSNLITFVSVFAYFTFAPVLLGGGTLGMRIFNLRIEDRVASVPAPLRAHLVRGTVKTICLQVLFPFLTLLFLTALAHPRKLALHDILARTRVVRGPAFQRT